MKPTRVSTRLGTLAVRHAGSGPAVVLWPSLFCDGRTLQAQSDELQRDYTVLLIDGPGHGDSDPLRAPATLADCAEASVEVQKHFGFERSGFIGSAWGGMVGVELALLHPALVDWLVLVNTPLNSWSRLKRIEYWLEIQLLRFFGAFDLLTRFAAMAMLSRHTRREQPAVERLLIDCIRKPHRRALADAMDSVMLRRRSQLPDLPRIKTPTLFLAGADDRILPPAAARQQARELPGAAFELIERSGHLSCAEAPARVNSLIRSFLAGLPVQLVRGT